MEKENIDLTKLPMCDLEKRVVLVMEHAAARSRVAIDYIKNRYPKTTAFQECMDFVKFDLLDCMRSDFESLGRVWLFPATEAEQELSECINRLLDCSYKASRDNMRRAVELILVGAFFSHSHISPSDATSWLKSTRGTPYFSRTVNDLKKLPRFDRLNTDHNWAAELSEFYWRLSDTIHTRGMKHSFRELQPTHATINCISVPEFNDAALQNCLNMYMETIGHMAIILAAYNPILLIGLPILQKFADNAPLSGFFEEPQSERLWRLIPQHYHSSFRHIVEVDDEVVSARNWIDDLPDKF